MSALSFTELVQASKRMLRLQDIYHERESQNDLVVARIGESDVDRIIADVDPATLRGELSGVRFATFFGAVHRCRRFQKAYYRSRRDRVLLLDKAAAERTLRGLIETINKRRPLEEGGGVQGEMFAAGGQS